MKKNVCGVGKKVLASALSAAMVIAFTPAVGSAVGSDDAVAYAEDAAAATLLTSNDIHDGQITISDSGSYKLGENVAANIVVVAGADVDIDLGGFTLTNAGNGKATLSVRGTATVHEGSIIGGASYYNIEVPKGSNGSLTLRGVTATAGNVGSSMIDNYGTLAIADGNYKGGLNVVKNEPNAIARISGGSFELDYAASGYTGVILNYGRLDVEGGIFTQASTKTYSTQQVICNMVSDNDPSSNLCANITSGTFVNKSTYSTARILHYYGKAPASSFNVTGGKYNKKPSSYCITDGYTATKGSDGFYTVAKSPYLKLSETKLSINEKAQPVQLTASVKPDDMPQDETVTWGSSDPEVAIVDKIPPCSAWLPSHPRCASELGLTS